MTEILWPALLNKIRFAFYIFNNDSNFWKWSYFVSKFYQKKNNQNWKLSKFNFWPTPNMQNSGYYRQLLNPNLATARLLYIFIKCLKEAFKMWRLLMYYSLKDAEASYE